MRAWLWGAGLALAVLSCDDGDSQTPSVDQGALDQGAGDQGVGDLGVTDQGAQDQGLPVDQGAGGTGGMGGEGGEGGAGGGPPHLPLADFCPSVTAARAQRAALCPGDPYGTPQPCFQAALEAAVAAGALTYDSWAAANCAGMLDSFCGLPPGCERVFIGQRPAGEPCPLGLECAPDAWCAPDPLTCPRTCVARPALGAACDPLGAPCAADQACVDGVCQIRPVAREACGPVPCAAHWVCAPDGICQTPALLGEACGDLPCAGHLACVGGTCASPGTAEAPCEADGDCLTGLACQGGRCAALPGVGEPCYELQCADARCDFEAVPPTCAAWPAAGDACLPGDRCGPADRCVAGACQAKAAAGEPCAQANHCASGRCGGGVCRAADEPLCPVE